MKIGRQVWRSTAISTSCEQAIVVRGRDLAAELMGNVSFTECFWLLLTGAMPTAAQRRILDGALVAIAEHGLVPSVQASRMTLAAAPEALQGAVAAGLLGCGSVVLGASEAAGRFFGAILHRKQAGADLGQAVATVVQEYRAQQRAIPGYGHSQHKDLDPRARRLFAMAEDAGVAGAYVEIARTVERLLPDLMGKALALNVSGAIPAVLLDAGYPMLALKGVPLLARTAGLIAHLLEEQQRPIGFVMSHAAAEAIGYDDELPSGTAVNP